MDVRCQHRVVAHPESRSLATRSQRRTQGCIAALRAQRTDSPIDLERDVNRMLRSKQRSRPTAYARPGRPLSACPLSSAAPGSATSSKSDLELWRWSTHGLIHAVKHMGPTKPAGHPTGERRMSVLVHDRPCGEASHSAITVPSDGWVRNWDIGRCRTKRLAHSATRLRAAPSYRGAARYGPASPPAPSPRLCDHPASNRPTPVSMRCARWLAPNHPGGAKHIPAMLDERRTTRTRWQGHAETPLG